MTKDKSERKIQRNWRHREILNLKMQTSTSDLILLYINITGTVILYYERHKETPLNKVFSNIEMHFPVASICLMILSSFFQTL